MDVLNLNSLCEILPDWSQAQSNYFVEGLSVGLERQKHTTGVVLDVKGLKDFKIGLEWNPCDKNTHSSWKEPKKIAEMGATAVAFFLTEKLTDYIPSEEALIGTGIDYWLGWKEAHPEYDEDNFMNARLEISGINFETRSNTIESRVLTKKAQVVKSDDKKIPVYISISEFNSPKTIFIEK